MSALGDGAFKARVEGIAGEEGQDVGLVGKSRMGAVVVHEGLESGHPANWFCRSRS